MLKTVLGGILALIDRIPFPEPPQRRGRPYVYPPRNMLKCFVVAVVKRLYNGYQMRAYFAAAWNEKGEIADEYIYSLACACGMGERLPSRWTFDRRFQGLPALLSQLILTTGMLILAQLAEKAGLPQEKILELAVADSSLFKAKGNLWHVSQMAEGIIPACGNIDVTAHWGKSGCKGWIFGFKLHLFVLVVGAVIIPFYALVTAANFPDNKGLMEMLKPVPAIVRRREEEDEKQDLVPLVADEGYDDGKLRPAAAEKGLMLRTPVKVGQSSSAERKELAAFHNSAKGRKLYHRRSTTIEPFIGQYKDVLALGDDDNKLPVQGLERVRPLLLAGVLVMQLAIYDNLRQGRPPRQVKYLLLALR